MNKKLIFVVVFLFSTACFAQRPDNSSLKAEAKVLSFEDSMQIEELFFAGLREKTIENLQQSAIYFKQIITLDPANDASFFELANIYHKQSQEKEAELMARQAIAVKPKNEWYWRLLADIYNKSNNFQQLSQVYDELIRIAPQKEDYYFEKASTLLKQNKPDEALEVYNAIEKKYGLSDDLLNARQRIYQKQGKTDIASLELEKLVKNNPSDVKNYIELSRMYFESGNKDKALQVLQEGKNADPTNAFVRIALSNMYRLQGKAEEAYAELKSAFENPAMDADSKVRIIISFLPQLKDQKIKEQANSLAAILIQVHPRNAKAQAVYGDILLQENKRSEAQKSYKKAVELDGQDYDIWDNLIRLEISESDFDAAIKDGEEALTLFPSQASLYLYTGMAYSRKKNHEKAIKYLKNAESLETEDKEKQAQIYSSMGDSYNALKNYKESDQSYEKALQASPNNTYAMNNYAYYLSLRGENLAKAEQMSRRSNELEPNNTSFEDTYAWVMFRQKKYKEARTWIEKAIKNDKTVSSAQAEHYGDILIHLGETELAIQQWTKAKANGAQTEKLNRKISEKKYIE